jgi:hypothetical protein
VAADILARAEQLAVGPEEAGRVEAAGGGESGLCGAQPFRELGRRAWPGTRSELSTRGASTATASRAPLPHTPQDEVV